MDVEKKRKLNGKASGKAGKPWKSVTTAEICRFARI